MKLEDVITPQELKRVFEEDESHYTMPNSVEGRTFIEFICSNIDDAYLDVIADHGVYPPQAAGMLRALAYINHHLKGKK